MNDDEELPRSHAALMGSPSGCRATRRRLDAGRARAQRMLVAA
jgi:hypothetical protein